jgi:hypothetical protein
MNQLNLCMEVGMKNYVVSFLMVLLICGFVDSQAQGIAAKACVEKCCVESGWNFDNVCDFGGGQADETFNQCLSTCMSDSNSGQGGGAQGQGASPKQVPEAAKVCLKKCCDQIQGEYDTKSSYCNTDYDTSMTESFQTCQRNCVLQNMQGNTPKPSGGAATAGNTPSGSQQPEKTPTSCVPLLTGIFAMLTAGIGTKLM